MKSRSHQSIAYSSPQIAKKIAESFQTENKEIAVEMTASKDVADFLEQVERAKAHSKGVELVFG